MNAIQIAYFKHFLYDKDLQRNYLYFYRQNRIKGSPSGDKDGNPESIEQFFLQTPVEDVILKAFYFLKATPSRPNSSYDYWKGIDDQWQEYMKSNESNFSNDKWPILKGTFAILRQNWDLDHYWRKENLESTEEVYTRMKIDLPLPSVYWEHGEGSLHNSKDGEFVVIISKFDHGGIGRTTFIIKEVVTYDPETSYLQPNQLHCKWDPEKRNVHIAYLHASYNSMGADFHASVTEGRQIHAVINDDSEATKYRLAFDGEIDAMTKKLAENGLAWNPDKREIVQLSEAKEEEPPLIEFSDEQEEDLSIEFIEIDTSSRRTVNALQKGVMSVNTRSASWRTTINRMDSKDIKKGNFKYVRLGKVNDDLVMMFNNQQGINVVLNGDGYYNVNSRKFVEALHKALDIKAELIYLNIEKYSERVNSLTYKISKQQ